MPLSPITLGKLPVSRFILGGNPFSGFSHQSKPRDSEMLAFHTTAGIKQTLRHAESLGITTHISRGDQHVIRYLREYWQEGGTIDWICQTCPMVGSLQQIVEDGINNRAKAIFFHGGMMDRRVRENDQLDELPRMVEKVRAAGLPVGVAGHHPRTFAWASQNLDLDFYMCAYYSLKWQSLPGGDYRETFDPADRDAMLAAIAKLKKPVIHYKVMAAGRIPPAEALTFVGQHLRPSDAVCVGICLKDNPRALEDNLRTLEQALTQSH
jgi:hypothetical protein